MPPSTSEVKTVCARIPTWPHIPRKFTRQSHLASAIAPNYLFSSPGGGDRVGSISIARSTFRCLACPCVVLGRGSAHRPVPTVSTRLQPTKVFKTSVSKPNKADEQHCQGDRPGLTHSGLRQRAPLGAPIRQLSFLWHSDRLADGAPNRQLSFGWHQLYPSQGAPKWHMLAPPPSTGVSTSYGASKSLRARKPPAWSSSRAAAASARAAWPLSSPADYRVTAL